MNYNKYRKNQKVCFLKNIRKITSSIMLSKQNIEYGKQNTHYTLRFPKILYVYKTNKNIIIDKLHNFM